jgi:glyoxylase-like metal-dependent hydrolase (beta-lactamase superfamily II)
VADGIRRLSVPIMGLPIAETLIYVLEASEKLFLIDAGWNDEPAWAALQDRFRLTGLDLGAVEGIVVTHHHPDHSGLAGRIQQHSGAWIAMHQADCELLEEVAALGDGHIEWELANLRSAGAADADLDAFRVAGSMVAATRPTMPDRRVSDSDRIHCGTRDLVVIPTPGHTPGHMCLGLEDEKIVFVGDHVLSRTTPHVGLYDYPLASADPLSDYLRSLDLLRGYAGYQILPAHEGVIDDLPGRIREIVRHHASRSEEAYAAMASEPQTLWSVASQMTWVGGDWEDLTPVSRQLALAEAAAHVRYLLTRGIVRRLPGGTPERFVGQPGAARVPLAGNRWPGAGHAR